MTTSQWKKLYPLFVERIRKGETPLIVLTDDASNIPQDLWNKCMFVNDMEEVN